MKRRNPSKALDLFERLALEHQDPVARLFLGVIHTEGDTHIPINHKAGFNWFSEKHSDHRRWSYAMAAIAFAYESGLHVPINHKEASNWYRIISIRDDNESGPMDDGQLYLFDNKKFKLNFSSSTRALIDSVQQRSNHRFISLGHCCYRKKSLVPYAIRRYLLWDLLTNKKSTAVAASQLSNAVLHMTGYPDLERNINRSLFWAAQGAKNNCPKSCMLLGLVYEKGIDLEENHKEAMKWYKKAFELDSSNESAYRIGALYYLGKGVERNYEEALVYLRKAAYDGKCGKAYFLMGHIYEKGKCVRSRDYELALKCYERAYFLDEVSGPISMALLYCKGLGVEKNEEIACTLFNIAESMGCLVSKSILSFIHILGFQDALPIITQDWDLAHNLFSKKHVKSDP